VIILKPTVKDSFTAAAVKAPGIHDGERMKAYLDKESNRVIFELVAPRRKRSKTNHVSSIGRVYTSR